MTTTLPKPAVARPKARRRVRLGAGEGRLAAMLIAPTIVLLAVVIGYPVVSAVITSFTRDQSLHSGFFTRGGGFAGLDNYIHWLAQRCGNAACPPGTLGSQFWSAIGVTVFFTVTTVVLEVVLGTAMALVMNRSFAGRAILRASVLVPWAIPTAVTAKLWFFMFAYDGVVNHVLGTHILWTDGEWASRFAVVIGDVWKTTPFVALLVLAGLQIIPGEVHEAARVDGAGAWRRFTSVTLPLLRPALLVAALFRLLDVLRIYDLPAILTHGGGGDGHATTTLSILVIQQIQQGYGGASALSTITFLFIFGIAFALVKLFNLNVVRSQQRAVN
ncbi:carbohydrate ABC transporter permease [Amycolatopsis australiensis]|uniref:Carbohydrate ABC transporter membrane protein 1, CUT1 family n=1 Tax=Amycolatopsis australiensis TaxID=546364 RepID=A0A1K1RTT7_9PSEU|nr:sugar ABC transporter permease [Amycolatopsis australiensis]SFW75229.1 carbohydrate ABC transporter membrane protein 1, CUT1 family [Amycolatopsis australiensis]